MGDIPGYSLGQDELNHLRELGITPEPPSNPGASARLLAAQYFRDNPEPVQDPRLRTGNPFEQHKAAVAAAIRDLGYIEPGASQLAILAHRVEVGGNVHQAVHEMGLPEAPVRTRSAETVLRRRV